MQKLPTCRTPADRDAVDAFALQWHLDHYSVEADTQTRDNDPSIQHLSFLYGVSCGTVGSLASLRLAVMWLSCEHWALASRAPTAPSPNLSCTACTTHSTCACPQASTTGTKLVLYNVSTRLHRWQGSYMSSSSTAFNYPEL